MDRRKKIKIENYDLWLAPPEYVIVRKLEFFKHGGSSKHLSDIKKMLEISADEIDLIQLKQKIHEYNLTEEWTKVKKDLLT